MALSRKTITLEDYLRHELAEGKQEYRVVASQDHDGPELRFYIHPLGRDGESRDFVVEADKTRDVSRFFDPDGKASGPAAHEREVKTEKSADALNAAFAADPNAIHCLLVNRVPCNQMLADDRFVPVELSPVLPPGCFQVNAIGLVNAVLAANGLPLVAYKMSFEEGRSKMLGFFEYQLPETIVGKPLL